MRRLSLSLVALVFMACNAVAHADVIFDFSGTCTSGPPACLVSTYTGQLDLVSTFVPGSVVKQSDVISMELLGRLFDDEFPPQDIGTNICGLPASGTCSGQNLGLQDPFNPGYFFTFADGTWRFDAFGGELSVQGTNGTWTQVPQTPLPPSWLLLATALLGFLCVPRLIATRRLV
jgi:hypothetical protein